MDKRQMSVLSIALLLILLLVGTAIAINENVDPTKVKQTIKDNIDWAKGITDVIISAAGFFVAVFGLIKLIKSGTNNDEEGRKYGIICIAGGIIGEVIYWALLTKIFFG